MTSAMERLELAEVLGEVPLCLRRVMLKMKLSLETSSEMAMSESGVGYRTWCVGAFRLRHPKNGDAEGVVYDVASEK